MDERCAREEIRQEMRRSMEERESKGKCHAVRHVRIKEGGYGFDVWPFVSE